MAAGPGVTVSAMLAFIPRLLSMLYVEMLVHGNASAAEVKPPYDVILSKYQCFWTRHEGCIYRHLCAFCFCV